jgi:hypothetical protein
MIESKQRENEKRCRSYSGEGRGDQLAEADQEPIICLPVLTQQNSKYGDKNVSNQTLCGEVMSPQLPGRVMGYKRFGTLTDTGLWGGRIRCRWWKRENDYGVGGCQRGTTWYLWSGQSPQPAHVTSRPPVTRILDISSQVEGRVEKICRRRHSSCEFDRCCFI